MSVESWVAIAVGISTLLTSFLLALRWVIKAYLAELKPNGGGSLKDQVNRLEARVDTIIEMLHK